MKSVIAASVVRPRIVEWLDALQSLFTTADARVQDRAELDRWAVMMLAASFEAWVLKPQGLWLQCAGTCIVCGLSSEKPARLTTSTLMHRLRDGYKVRHEGSCHSAMHRRAFSVSIFARIRDRFLDTDAVTPGDGCDGFVPRAGGCVFRLTDFQISA